MVQAQPEEATHPAIFVRVGERAHAPAEEPLEGVVQEADPGEEGHRGEDVPEDDPGVLVIVQAKQGAQPDAGKVARDGEQDPGDGIVRD